MTVMYFCYNVYKAIDMRSMKTAFDQSSLVFGSETWSEYLSYSSPDGKITRIFGDFEVDENGEYSGQVDDICFNWKGSFNSLDFRVDLNSESLDVSTIIDAMQGGGAQSLIEYFSEERVTVVGTWFNDFIIAGDGDGSVVWGCRGNDQIWSGDGRTTFLVGRSEGRDTIFDFQPGEDVLDFGKFFGGNGSTAPNPSKWKSIKKHSKTKDGDTIIKYKGGTEVILDSVKFKTLHQSDFDF